MSSSTQGIVLTEFKDVFEIQRIILKVLSNYKNNLKKKINQHFSDNTATWAEFHLSRTGNDYIITYFVDDESPRQMYIFFDIHDDPFPETKKIVFSLGDWGNSVKIITEILQECFNFGKCYLVKSTLTDEIEVLN